MDKKSNDTSSIFDMGCQVLKCLKHLLPTLYLLQVMVRGQ